MTNCADPRPLSLDAVDPTSSKYLQNLPIFRVGFVLVKVLCYLFRTTFSSLMVSVLYFPRNRAHLHEHGNISKSVLVIFISSRKYFFKVLASSADPNWYPITSSAWYHDRYSLALPTVSTTIIILKLHTYCLKHLQSSTAALFIVL